MMFHIPCYEVSAMRSQVEDTKQENLQVAKLEKLINSQEQS